MNLIKIIRAINEAFEVTSFDGDSDIDKIRKLLTEQYWYLSFENEDEGIEIWRHRDDPYIGEYVIKVSFDGNQILGLFYRNGTSKIFNEKFKNMEEFELHLANIMHEPLDIENGMKHLRQIRDDLLDNED